MNEIKFPHSKFLLSAKEHDTLSMKTENARSKLMAQIYTPLSSSFTDNYG
jgi:hypothetical protein